MTKIEINYGKTNYDQMNKIDLEMLCMSTIKMVKSFYKNPKSIKAFKE